MVLHVHVEEAEHWPEMDGPRIELVVEYIVRQPDMLRHVEKLLDRAADHSRDRPEKQHRKTASQIQRQLGRRRHDDNPEPRLCGGAFQQCGAAALEILCRQTAAGRNDDVPEFCERARYQSDVHHKLGHSRRRRRHDLGVAFDDDGMPVMGVVAVRAKEGLAHRHEASDLEKKPVQPSRAEGGAMAGFVFARLRAGRIDGAVGEQRDGGALVSPQRHGQKGKARNTARNNDAGGRPDDASTL